MTLLVIKLKIFELDTAKFISAPGLACRAALDLLTDIDMLLMLEKGICGEICHSIHRYAKANNKYVKDYKRRIVISSILDVNNLCGLAMSLKLPINNFHWIKDTSKFKENFIKNYNEESDEG